MTWTSTRSSPAQLLFWCIAGTAIVQVVIARASAGNPDRFSRIFWHLLTAFDTHGNVLLLAVVVCAFFLRRQPAALAAVRFAAERPWRVAAALFPLLCIGSLRVYHNYPLSMDEYATAFQAQAFAAGRLTGAFPADLIDRLIPGFFQNYFFSVARTSGEVSSTYWPGFSLLLAPFFWLDVPWAANPAIGALTIPAIHRLTAQMSASRDAPGWAVLITLASPAFIVSSISYYSMSAHLLCNLLFALLLLQPSVPRALLAGAIGSLALTLHNPVPHMLFGIAFIAWLCFQPGRKAVIGALILGYLPLTFALGLGWHQHIAEMARVPGPAAANPGAGLSLLDAVLARIDPLLHLPHASVVQARIAGLSKLWTWGAPGFMVLAAYGFLASRTTTGTKLLGTALAITFFGYFFVPFDQGHGWGYRYLHSAWFVIPVFGSIALTSDEAAKSGDALRNFCAWAMVLSLILANGARLLQVDSFISRHLNQVPPLARAPAPDRTEVVFVNLGSGFYTQDMVQNDPFLRGPRITMLFTDPADTADFMARRYPRHVLTDNGPWGQLWIPGAESSGR